MGRGQGRKSSKEHKPQIRGGARFLRFLVPVSAFSLVGILCWATRKNGFYVRVNNTRLSKYSVAGSRRGGIGTCRAKARRHPAIPNTVYSEGGCVARGLMKS